jgi:hypothetical protein
MARYGTYNLSAASHSATLLLFISVREIARIKPTSIHQNAHKVPVKMMSLLGLYINGTTTTL